MNIRKPLCLAWAWCMALSLEAKDIYVSTSFHEPATEGLRFVYSRDGIRWDSIQGVFLRPEVGLQKVMRDPSVVKGPDGVFHLVWTSSWRGDRGFGYASSRDLIHWTEQRFISTGMDTTTVNTGAVLRRREAAVPDSVGLVCARTVPRRTGRPQEQPPSLLHDDQGLPPLFQGTAVLRAGLLGH